MDNRYDDLYSILTYFIGLGKAGSTTEPYVQRHEFEGRKLGRQGREWANKVLRKEDIEVRMPTLCMLVLILTRAKDIHVPALIGIRPSRR